MLIDARYATSGTEFHCDLCVVGSGPAGLSLVERLRGSGLSIVLLESGGLDLDLATQNLYRGEIDGQDYFRLDACRWRLFGGSSNRWGGWCRPLEAADFAQHDWLPHSGWPIDAETLEPYQSDAAKLFELPNAIFDLAAWRDRLPAPLALDDSNFESIVFQFSPETNFARVHGARVLAAENVTTLLYANLTRINLAPGSRRVAALNVETLTGRKFNVLPKAVVLAAGGIENARLLLASRTDRPSGIGNEFDMVGRFFMEHLHVPAGHLVVAPGAGNNDLYRKAVFPDVRLRGVVAPPAAARERHRLLATSIAVERPSFSFGTPFVGWPPAITFGPVRRYRKLRTGRFKAAAERMKQIAEYAQAVPKKVHSWKVARAARARVEPAFRSHKLYSLYFRAEQAPDPSNRVMLSERRDALGVPETRLNWRASRMDIASIMGWLTVLDTDMRASGKGRVITPAEGWQEGIIGGPHHMGTTRMSANPRDGVVDADCRVHSVDNLYIAGSSVFATCGYANPTFAIVTLALRLADTLRKRLP